jgi:hypothetical protein
MDMSKNKPSRKPYNKPVVQEVRLRIKEAVLDISCRTLSATGTYAREGSPDVCVLGGDPCLTP